MKQSKKHPEVFQSKPHISKHLPPVPVFFNQSPDLEGWTEGTPGVGRVVGIKSVLYSDGSARRWYRMAAPKKLQQTKTPREKRVKKK